MLHLMNEWHLLTPPALSPHHGGEGNAPCAPVSRVLGKVGHAGHHPGAAGADEGGSGEAERVAKVAVEVGGGGATALIREVVVLRRESPWRESRESQQKGKEYAKRGVRRDE